MKKIFYIFAIATIALTACDKNELIPADSSTQLSPEDLKLSIAMQKVAKEICKTTNDNNSVKEIYNMVNASVNFGRDEEVNFVDLLSSGESKIVANRKTTKIAKVIAASNSVNEIDESISILLDNGTRLYWPYSEKWDGVKQPVITYAAVDSKEDKLIAYKYVTENGVSKTDSLIVDEEYAKNNPVWVITKSETDYESLPNFIKGESVKNNIYYACPSKKAKNNIQKVISEDYPLNDSNYVYNLVLGRVQCLVQYDSWFFGGGSELRFTMVGAKMLGGQVSADFATSLIECYFTRSQISDKVIKDYNTIINLDFAPRETYNGFIIWENDKKSPTQTVKFDVGYDKIKASAEFKIGGTDPIIYKISLERSAFFTTNKIDIGNGLWNGFTIYGGGDVRYNLPWIITPRAY